MKKLLLLFLMIGFMTAAEAQMFTVMLPDSLSKKPLNGRLLLILSIDSTSEPRFQVEDGPNSQLIFGMDVDNWKPSTAIHFSKAVLAIPLKVYKKFRLVNTMYKWSFIFMKLFTVRMDMW
jgi:hypothetical protein